LRSFPLLRLKLVEELPPLLDFSLTVALEPGFDIELLSTNHFIPFVLTFVPKISLFFFVPKDDLTKEAGVMV